MSFNPRIPNVEGFKAGCELQAMLSGLVGMKECLMNEGCSAVSPTVEVREDKHRRPLYVAR
ncbi:hypothetical protein JZ751_020827 [Albula glossodonta]|uniref:Uncharacterized protein n=1 Tax=Albula glossodonta TaxID=121402 RepID=A0A8T2PGF5_9TELE|nr:hypothetical protein JZ751_020827 [Albula glossodonta]